MKKDQKIKCDVYDCKHCACEEENCELESIQVCSCNPEETKEATMCDSYKKKENEL